MKYLKELLLVLHCFLLYTYYISAQPETSSRLLISGAEVKRITEDRPVLSIWLASSDVLAESVKVSVPFIISSEGERIKLDYETDPKSVNIAPGKVGQLFNISFDASQIGKLETGSYTAIVVANSLNHTELKENLTFEIKASSSTISFLNEKAVWVKENIFSLLFSLLEMIGVLLIIIILIRVFRNLLGGKKALRILPIVDETGKSSEYGGIASGIDDLLQCKIQDILNLISKSIVSRSALSGIKTQDEKGIGGRSTNINILKGSEDIDPQKIGDLGVGILKIPLGSLIAVVSKMFGGTYVTGALQKYGSTNKLILTLEKRTFLSLKKKSVELFEGSWESSILSEGIQPVILELAYKIIIYLSEEINTTNWKAYRHFLDGNVLFSEYEENNSRKDKLRDAISCWRKSVRVDPKFAETHYNLGVALDRDNKIADALFRYTKAMEFGTNQTRVKAYANLARIYIQDIKDPVIARDLLSKAKNINPKHAELCNLEGLTYLNEQKDSDASNCFQKAIDFNKIEVVKNGEKEEPVYHYNLSVANYYLKNYPAAETSALRAYSLYPENNKPGFLLQTLGLIYNMRNDYEKSQHYFEEGLLKEPENKDMLDGYSTCLFHSKKIDKSFAVHKRLLRVYPEYYNGYFNMVRILEQKAFDAMSINIFTEIGNQLKSADTNSQLKSLQDNLQSKIPGSFEHKIYSAVLGGIFYYVRSDDNLANTFFKAAIDGDNPDFEKIFLAETLITHSLVLSSIGDYNTTVSSLIKVISLLDQNQYYDLAFCYELLAKAYSELKMNIEADSAYSNAVINYKKINMSTRASDIYTKRASWLIGLNFYKEAEDDCKQAVYLNRLNYQAYHNRGTMLYNFLKEAEAIPQYEHSVEIFFDVPGTHYTIGLCHFYLNNYDEAIKKFETTLKLNSDYASPDDMTSPDAYQRLAHTWETIGNFKNAEEVLRKAVNLFPRKVKYRLLLARVYKMLKKYSDAERELNYSLFLYESGLQPFKHLVLNELADLYLDFGVDYNLALDHITEAIKILEDSKDKSQTYKDDLSMLRGTLGWTYFKQKQYDEAKEILDKTLTAFIGDLKMHTRIATLYQKISESEKDDSLKSDYRNTAIEQWRIVYELSSDESVRKNAEEQLAKLLK